MMSHPTATDLELYVMGNHEGLALEELEDHLADCRDCMTTVRREARLELALLDVATRVVACPGCRRAISSARCGSCGATLRAGDFRVLSVVVQNAHGRLYLAEDAAGDRVALKELAFVQAPGSDAIAAFEREARFLRALEHPDIPRFVASFQEGEGVQTRLFLAQEYIEGESLLARLADHWFDEAEAIETARKVLDILVYLQELSPVVIHGDIKPANLIRRRDGSIVLVDFGAARSFNGNVTTAVGTFGYMPTEQLAGIVNPTTDLYGLGASLIHLLGREEPWKVLEDPAALGALNVSPELRRFLAKLTARRAVERFPNARAARAALARLHAKPVRRMPWLAAAIAVVAVVTGGTGFTIAKLTSKGERVSFEPQRVLPRLPVPAPKLTGDFMALYDDSADGKRLASFTVLGGVEIGSGALLPSNVTAVAQDPMTGRWYVIDDSVLGWFEWPGTFHSLEIEPAPSLVGPGAIAFDTRRRRLLVTAQGDEQTDFYLFAYAVDSGSWTRIANLGALELDSLAYAAHEDRLYGLSGGFLSTLDSSGKVVDHHPLKDAGDAQLVYHDNQLLLIVDGDVRPLGGEKCVELHNEKAGKLIAAGDDRGALAELDSALACGADRTVLGLAFMEACSAHDEQQAKRFYRRLQPADRARLSQFCLRAGVAFH